MIAHLPGVIGETRVPQVVIRGFECFEVSLQGSFGIHHYILSSGKPHDEVGPQPAFTGADGFLFREIAVGKHARDFLHTPQLNLAPAPAHIWSAQRPHQIAGL